jgi:hypothetical protein
VAITTPTPEAVALRPETFRLPKPGVSDPFFGFSRAFYYAGEQRGYWKLIRIRDEGKERGVTLVPYQAVAEFVRAQMETQEGGTAAILSR